MWEAMQKAEFWLLFLAGAIIGLVFSGGFPNGWR
jgi:hypothetical protein